MVLILAENIIINLSRELFWNLKNFRQLSVDGNSLTSLENDLFVNLTSLESLYLSNNKLQSLSFGLFHAQRNLQTLILSYNQVRYLPAGLFENALRLQLLELRNNHFFRLDVTLFESTASLVFVDLSENRLQYITSLSVTRLAYLNLRDNPLTNIDKLSRSDGLHNESEILVSQHEICICYAPVHVNCSATNPRSPYLTCDRFLSDRTLTVIMWVIGLNACLEIWLLLSGE